MVQMQANSHSNIVQTPVSGPPRACHHCGSVLSSFARFCGECGASGMNTGPMSVVNFASVQAMSPMQSLSSQPHWEQPNQGFQYSQNTSAAYAITPVVEMPQPQGSERAPKFASVAPQITHVDPALRAELTKHVVLLARERLFLYLHCINFLIINAFGFWLSLKAYNEYNADELTKTIIALTPLMFINSLALVCLSPIKGTKIEIARLKEKVKYIKVQIEFRNITL
jgi:hypothetical protein